MYYEQLARLCEEKGTTPTAFTRDVLKLSTSKVTAWKNGSIPKYEILKKVADYFGVTVGYLFDGGTATSVSQLTQTERECIKKFRMLTELDQGRILDRMETMCEGYVDNSEDMASGNADVSASA